MTNFSHIEGKLNFTALKTCYSSLNQLILREYLKLSQLHF